MRLYANQAGELIQTIVTDSEEAMYPDSPPGAVESLAIDIETNPQVVSLVCGLVPWHELQLTGGILYAAGQPVTINPPGEHYQDHEYLRTWWKQLNTALVTVDDALLQTEQAGSLWPTLTAKQKQDWLVAHFDEVLGGLALVLRVLHGVLRFIRWLIRRLEVTNE